MFVYFPPIYSQKQVALWLADADVIFLELPHLRLNPPVEDSVESI